MVLLWHIILVVYHILKYCAGFLNLLTYTNYIYIYKKTKAFKKQFLFRIFQICITLPCLEITILKFPDINRFSITSAHDITVNIKSLISFEQLTCGLMCPTFSSCKRTYCNMENIIRFVLGRVRLFQDNCCFPEQTNCCLSSRC